MEHVLPQAWNTFVDGEVILGRFEIVRHLGTGGMGEVYEANDHELGRIAIKTIRSHIASSRRAFDRFRQEVALARKVSGPQVCRIHELFLLPASSRRPATAFLTMEYLAGTPLSSKIRSSHPLLLNEVLDIALDICEGLHLIHQQGIVHRDLKPANIMLCKRGGKTRAVVMDFGLARDQGPESSSPDEPTMPAPQAAETLPGTIAGTPAYMAPEQIDGKPVSAATDIYALGLILYELLTGASPHAPDTPVGVALKRMRRRPLPSSIRKKIPRHWDRVIQRCLEYEPSDRYQSAEQVAKALKASPLSFENLRKDRTWVVQLACGVVLALVAWGGYHWWQWRQYYRPTAEEQRWYSEGLTALREGSYLKATRELSQATKQGGGFVMAHARLAEAWFDLDFDGAAQREMLIATGGERHLPPLDRMYLDGIRATLTHDFGRAVSIYRGILDRLPDPQRPAGYVDLGMAYERAGDPEMALEDYEHASKLDGENPAPYMHKGILEARLHKVADANGAFGNAEKIFAAQMDQEGLAELDYQRGYSANESGESAQADEYLKRALERAKQIQSAQLQIRALTQLSSSASGSGHGQQGVDFAEQSIQLARENQLNAWAADGLARLAQARIVQGDDHYKEAEEALDEAKTLATQSEQRRVEALANGVLASLFDLEGRPDDVIAPANAALAYYEQNGYFEPAAKANLLVVRSQVSTGQLDKAQQEATRLLKLAQQSGNQELITYAEDAVGSVFLQLQRYPEAVIHFRRAWENADIETLKSYEAIDYANALQKIGWFDESDRILGSIADGDPNSVTRDEVRAESLLGRRKYSEVLKLAREAISEHPSIVSGYNHAFEMDQAIAYAYLDQKTMALDHLDRVTGSAERNTNPRNEADLQLIEAEVDLEIGKPQAARTLAEDAAAYFGANGIRDSELRSYYLATAASMALKDQAGVDSFYSKAEDTRHDLERTWDARSLELYFSRPDLRALMRELPQKDHSG